MQTGPVRDGPVHADLAGRRRRGEAGEIIAILRRARAALAEAVDAGPTRAARLHEPAPTTRSTAEARERPTCCAPATAMTGCSRPGGRAARRRPRRRRARELRRRSVLGTARGTTGQPDNDDAASLTIARARRRGRRDRLPAARASATTRRRVDIRSAGCSALQRAAAVQRAELGCTARSRLRRPRRASALSRAAWWDSYARLRRGDLLGVRGRHGRALQLRVELRRGARHGSCAPAGRARRGPPDGAVDGRLTKRESAGMRGRTVTALVGTARPRRSGGHGRLGARAGTARAGLPV